MKTLNIIPAKINSQQWLLSLVLIFAFFPGYASIPESASHKGAQLLPPGSEVIRNIPIDAVFYNPCCDEDVHLFGTAQVVINENIMHIVVSGITGTGLTTGYDYDGRGPSVETNVFYSNQNEGTLTFKLRMTNEDGCSFSLKATFQIEMNANGVITVAFQKFDVKCN